MRSMVHMEWSPIASHFLAKFTTFSGLVNGAGLTKQRPMFAILTFPFVHRLVSNKLGDPADRHSGRARGSSREPGSSCRAGFQPAPSQFRLLCIFGPR